MADRTIPAHFHIYLLTHSCASQIGYVRTSQTMSLTKNGPEPPLEGRQRNTQQISVILGSAMLFINSARVDGFKIEDAMSMPKVVPYRIWPPNVAPITWPSDTVLTCDQMRDLAYSMKKIMALPQAKWGGDIIPVEQQ
jgi:hypothetical protein